MVHEGSRSRRLTLNMAPIAISRFHLKEFGVDIEFKKNDEGKIDRPLLIREGIQHLTSKRVDEPNK